MVTWTLPEPYDRAWMQWYLSAHAIAGVERWDGSTGTYARAVRTGAGSDVLRIQLRPGEVRVSLASGGMPDAGLAAAVHRMLDLDRDGAAVVRHLSADSALAPAIAAAPGLRVPGVLDGWQLLVRTMIGQQISLAAARTHLGRLVAALGESVRLPDGDSWRLFPTAAIVAARGHEVLTGPQRRVAAILAAARLVADGGLDLSLGRESTAVRRDLLALPGIGPWTADYVAMRLAPDPDILLASDLVVRQGATALGADLGKSARWAPYRSYATMHLWRAALLTRRGRLSA